MAWIFQTIAKLLLGAMSEVFSIFADDFITVFGINIGANFPSVSDTETKSLASVLESYPSTTGLGSAFDNFFPLSTFKIIFVGMAFTIATALFINEIRKAMSAPLVGTSARQTPIRSVAKYIACMFGIVLSYRIFIILEYIGNMFYMEFAKIAIKGIDGDISGWSIDASTKDNFSALTLSSSDSASLFPGITDLTMVLMSLVVTWMLFLSFIKLIIEIVERYVVLGLLFYTAPLPFSSLVSDDTSDVFKSWIRMVVSEIILISTNSLFIGVFIGAVRKVSINLKTNINVSMGTGAYSWLIYMFMLIAWLQIAQRFDSYLHSLGLSTAQTGGGVANAIVGGFTAAVGGAISLGSKGIRAYKSSDAGQINKYAKEAGRLGGKEARNAVKEAGLRGGKDAAKSVRDDVAAVAAATPEARNAKNAAMLQNRGYNNLKSTMYGGQTSSAKVGDRNFDNVQKDALKTAEAFGLNREHKENIRAANTIGFDGKGNMTLGYKDGSKQTISPDMDGKHNFKLSEMASETAGSGGEAAQRLDKALGGSASAANRLVKQSNGELKRVENLDGPLGACIQDNEGNRTFIKPTAATDLGSYGSGWNKIGNGDFSAKTIPSDRIQDIGSGAFFADPDSELGRMRSAGEQLKTSGTAQAILNNAVKYDSNDIPAGIRDGVTLDSGEYGPLLTYRDENGSSNIEFYHSQGSGKDIGGGWAASVSVNPYNNEALHAFNEATGVSEKMTTYAGAIAEAINAENGIASVDDMAGIHLLPNGMMAVANWNTQNGEISGPAYVLANDVIADNIGGFVSVPDYLDEGADSFRIKKLDDVDSMDQLMEMFPGPEDTTTQGEKETIASSVIEAFNERYNDSVAHAGEYRGEYDSEFKSREDLPKFNFFNNPNSK